MARAKPIVLHGGRKPRRISKIQAGARIGGGLEGNVYNAEIELARGEKTRKRKLALKRFFDNVCNYPTFRNPLKQFQIMRELREINRKKNLGLRIPPTIRLRKVRNGAGPQPKARAELLITKLPIKNLAQMTKEERALAGEDIFRQTLIAEREGFIIGIDAFEFALDPKTKKPVAIIADFGNVKKISEQGPRE